MMGKLGKESLDKSDIKSAFRLLRISPADFELLDFKLDEHFFVNKIVLFGSSISKVSGRNVLSYYTGLLNNTQADTCNS